MSEHATATDHPETDTDPQGGVMTLVNLAVAGVLTGWFGTTIFITDIIGAVLILVAAIVVGVLAGNGKAPLSLAVFAAATAVGVVLPWMVLLTTALPACTAA